ncbi:MAG: DUF5656 family protein [Dehalococcoidia bacterium]
MARRSGTSLRGLRAGKFRAVEYINLLALIVGIISGLFIITGTVPALVILPVLAGLGLDGILRTHPAGRVRGATTAVLDLVTPVTFAFAAALFFRYAASGYWTVLAAVATGLLFAAVAYAAYYAQDTGAEERGVSRISMLSAAYAALFALLAVFYSADFSFPAAALLAGIAAALAAIEVFRDADLRPLDLAICALAAGVFLAQARWAAGFVRIDGILAATLLVVVFYVGTGVAVSALSRRLDQRAGMEYAIVAIVGLAVVLVGRLTTGT